MKWTSLQKKKKKKPNNINATQSTPCQNISDLEVTNTRSFIFYFKNMIETLKEKSNIKSILNENQFLIYRLSDKNRSHPFLCSAQIATYAFFF